MKKIALLADGWRRYVTYSWIEGVPQDFKVTGFDNLDKAAYFNPQITTVEPQ